MVDSVTGPLIAFFAAVGLIPLLRPFAVAVGLTDKPGERKHHDGEIPLVGGIAIFLAISLAILLGPANLTEMPSRMLAWFVASLLLVVTGACDDALDLSAATRFGAQIMAALIMIYWGDTLLRDLGYIRPSGALQSLHWLAVPFTVFATVGVINAVNMSDGLDGLSGNLSLVTLLGLGIANSFWGGPDSMPLINVVSAAIAGFLVFNQRMVWRSKAAVFLGDAGSMMLGLFLVWTAIGISQAPDRILSPAAVLWFLTIPIYDTVRVMLRRALQGRSPFAADSHHLHHLFVRAGYRVSETIAIICLLAAAGCLVGLAATWFGVHEFSLAVAFLAGGVIYYVAVEHAWRTMRLFGRPVAEL